MEWLQDREPFDAGSVGRAVGLAIAITIALTVFVVLVLAGVINWASAAAGL